MHSIRFELNTVEFSFSFICADELTLGHKKLLIFLSNFLANNVFDCSVSSLPPPPPPQSPLDVSREFFQ